MKPIIVLSLFDGVACGYQALKQADVTVAKYYSAEINKPAMEIANRNHSGIIPLGDINKWREWDIDWTSIDLLLAGFPCQAWSKAGKGRGIDDPRGQLALVLCEIFTFLKEKNSNIKFLFENVKMKKDHIDFLNELFGLEPIEINSSLVSAQNRVRLYWTNINNVTVPEDRMIFLKDILIDHGEDVARLINRKINPTTGKRDDYNKDLKFTKCLEPRKDKKSGCLTTLTKDNVVWLPEDYFEGTEAKSLLDPTTGEFIWQIPEATKKGFVQVKDGECVDLTFIHSKTRRGRMMQHKANCLTATKCYYCKHDNGWFRLLTPVECERLQTLPDNYTEGVSISNRYTLLGNGWTVSIIEHIFRCLK